MGKMKAMMDEFEKLRAEKEFMKMAKQYPGPAVERELGPQDSRGFRSTPVIQDYSELGEMSRQLQETIENNMRTLSKIKDLQTEIDKLTFRIGDAAFMPDHGNVIIKGISVDPENLETAYIVVGRKGEFRTKELLPINEATSVLYGQK